MSGYTPYCQTHTGMPEVQPELLARARLESPHAIDFQHHVDQGPGRGNRRRVDENLNTVWFLRPTHRHDSLMVSGRGVGASDGAIVATVRDFRRP